MFRLISDGTQIGNAGEFKNAVITICIGGDYFSIWETMCRNNWELYCDKYRYDLIVVSDYLDASDRGRSRSPAWQKLLVMDQSWAHCYKRIVWVDADIIASRDAPDVMEAVPDETKIGISLSGGQMSEAEQHIFIERFYGVVLTPEMARVAWRKHHRKTLDRIGAPVNAPMLNTGVMVMSRQHHATLLRSIYAQDLDTRLYEQPFISAELSRFGLAEIISPRFNWDVHEILVMNFVEFPTLPISVEMKALLLFILRNEMKKAYFLHFATSMTLMTLLSEWGIFSLEDNVGAPAVVAG
jgi:hypothetical protein